MTDRLDDLLFRLPDEAPAPDLASRIGRAARLRARARQVRRRAAGVALVCALTGAVLVALSWPEVMQAFGALPSAPETNAVAGALDDFLTAPLETLSGLVSAALVWESALAEGVGAALMLGIVLLAAAAFGGLAQLLGRAAPLNGHTAPH